MARQKEPVHRVQMTEDFPFNKGTGSLGNF